MMKKGRKKIPTKDLLSATLKLFRGIGGRYAEDVVCKLTQDPQYLKLVVGFMLDNLKQPILSTNLLVAHDIMGKNFMRFEEASCLFGAIFTHSDISFLGNVPFSEDELRTAKDTHLLIPVSEHLSLDIEGPLYRWYRERMYLNKGGEPRWQLIPFTIVPPGVLGNGIR